MEAGGGAVGPGASTSGRRVVGTENPRDCEVALSDRLRPFVRIFAVCEVRQHRPTPGSPTQGASPTGCGHTRRIRPIHPPGSGRILGLVGQWRYANSTRAGAYAGLGTQTIR